MVDDWSLDRLRDNTLIVLKDIPKDEINLVTLPKLRVKVAERAGIEIEQLKDSESKTVLLEAFQQFMEGLQQQQSKTKEEKEEEPEAFVEDDDDIPEDYFDEEIKSEKGKEKKVKSEVKKSVKKKKSVEVEKAKEKELKGKNKSVGESQIERLKSYIFKCGVRKVWKKELDGLNQKESIEELQGILQELGMDGRPTLEKCKEIKAKRELEAELKEIMDQDLIVEGKRRRSAATSAESELKKVVKRAVVESEEDEDEDEEEDVAEEDEVAEEVESEDDQIIKPIDFSKYGDPEDSD